MKICNFFSMKGLILIFPSMLIAGIIINYFIWDYLLFNYERTSGNHYTFYYLILASIGSIVMSMIGGAFIFAVYRNWGDLNETNLSETSAIQTVQTTQSYFDLKLDNSDTGDILDSKIDHYVIYWNHMLFSHNLRVPKGFIQKKDGTKLGILKAGGWINRYMYLLDTNEQIVLESRKNKFHSYKYLIKDRNKNKIGTVSGKTRFHFSNNMHLKNKHGNKILIVRGNIGPTGQFEIFTLDERNIAIGMWSPKFEHMARVAELKIIDLNFDRTQVWSLLMSFFSSYIDNSSDL